VFFSARLTARRPIQKWGLALFLASCAFAVPGVSAKSAVPPSAVSGEATVPIDKLPAEAATTLNLVHQGGPFPHAKDGTVFGNRERMLPFRPRGHYREYTVATVGVRHRGARRIVCGGREPTRPEACFYTADHYASFRRIVR
jgi:ribonuclease T1